LLEKYFESKQYPDSQKDILLKKAQNLYNNLENPEK